MNEKTFSMEPGIIYESIVTTSNMSNEVNAAPMGIYQDQENYIIIRPFTQSDTYQNLWAKEKAIINFTKDPALFTYCTLFQDELISDDFIKDDEGDFILSNSQKQYLKVEVVEKKLLENSERAYFRCKILKSELQIEDYQPFTRAFSLLVEILIHASRVTYFSTLDEQPLDLIQELQQSIVEHSKVIKRVVPTESIYCDLLRKILRKLKLE